MNDATIIKNYADAIDGNKCDKLNIDLDYGFKLVKREINVRKECEAYVASHDTNLSVKSMEMSLGAAIKLAEYFGTRAKVDKAINNYNANNRPVWNVRTLVVKLVPGQAAPKGKGDKYGRAEKDVKALTDAEFVKLAKAEAKRRGVTL